MTQVPLNPDHTGFLAALCKASNNGTHSLEHVLGDICYYGHLAPGTFPKTRVIIPDRPKVAMAYAMTRTKPVNG